MNYFLVFLLDFLKAFNWFTQCSISEIYMYHLNVAGLKLGGHQVSMGKIKPRPHLFIGGMALSME